ncbi:hypothetical protein JCM8097_006551 [Rhodosporidiobolus ruineniae]
MSALAIALLHAEGDQFNASIVQEGEKGGRTAAREVHRLLKREIEGGADLVVYHVADHGGCSFGNSSAFASFLRGFSSADEPSFLAAPTEGPGGSVNRITQLLFLNLPLTSISHIFLGSLHTNLLATYLEGVPTQLCGKITLLETVTIAPRVRSLVTEGHFRSTRALQGLFGELGGLESGFDFLGVDDASGTKEETEKAGLGWAAEPTAPSDAQSTSSSGPKKRMLSDAFTSSSSFHPPSPPPGVAAGSTTAPTPSSSSLPRFLPPPLQGVELAAATTPPRADSPPATRPASSSSPKKGKEKQKESGKGEWLQLGKRKYDAPSLVGAKVPDGLYPPPYPIPSGAFKPPLLRFPDDNKPCNRFQPEEWRQFKKAIKGTMCNEAKYGKCKMTADSCIQGHRCPYTLTSSPFEEKGTCHFSNAGLPHSVKM